MCAKCMINRRQSFKYYLQGQSCPTKAIKQIKFHINTSTEARGGEVRRGDREGGGSVRL